MTYTKHLGLLAIMLSLSAGASAQDQTADGEGRQKTAASEQASATELAPQEVVGEQRARQYRDVDAVSATKVGAPILDTPQSVSVVNNQIIADQGNRELEQALRNVTSIGRIANEGNVGGQNDITIRGFQTNRVFKNGFQFDNIGAPLMLGNIERVEVLKGPASILFGAVSPGGVVQAITKQPTAKPVLSLSVQADAFGRTATTLDAGGSFTNDGSVTYRTVLSRDQGDAFIDRTQIDDFLVSHSMAWQASDALRLDFHAEHFSDGGTFQYGLPFRGNEPDRRLPADRFLGETFNEKETENTFVQFRGHYQVNPANELRWHAGWVYQELTAVALRPFGGNNDVQDDNTIGRGFSLRNGDTARQYQFDVDYISRFEGFGVEHEVLLSAQYRDSESNVDSRTGNNSNAPAINVLDPRFNQISARELIESDDFVSFGPGAGNTGEQLQLVLQDSIWITPRLNLLASLGYTDVETSTVFPIFDLDVNNTGEQFLPRLGLLYKLQDTTSVYASYAESLEPNFGGNPDGQRFDPQEGDQLELGIKREWGDNSFASLAVYELTQTNIPESIGDGFSELIGEVRSRGIELEFTAGLLSALRLDGGYSYIDSEITTPGNANEGNSNPNVPEHRASLWLVGDIWKSDARRLEAGGGVFYESERFVNSANIKRLPSFTTVDFMLGQGLTLPNGDALRVQLNLINAFDERYFESGFVNAAQPGPSRTLLGTVTWEMG